MGRGDTGTGVRAVCGNWGVGAVRSEVLGSDVLVSCMDLQRRM